MADDDHHNSLSNEEVIKRIASGLSNSEATELYNLVKNVEHLLLRRTFKQIRWWAGAAGVLFTLFGIMSIVSFTNSVVSATSNILARDSDLKKDIEKRVVDKTELADVQLKKVADVLERAKELKAELATARNELETEKGRIASSLTIDLRDIRQMLEQIRPYLEAALKQVKPQVEQ